VAEVVSFLLSARTDKLLTLQNGFDGGQEFFIRSSMRERIPSLHCLEPLAPNLHQLSEPLLIRLRLADGLQILSFSQRQSHKSSKRFVIINYEHGD
jgi:hypothetical protein